MSNYRMIVYQCRKRDRRAQLEFYMLFYQSVYNSALRILNQPQEAEEVMQECFLKVLDTTELLKDDRNKMEKLLKRMAVNRSIDIYRKRKVTFVELDSCSDYQDEEDTAEEPEISLEIIHQLLKQLPEGYRMILSLHLLEDYSYEEIATRLQLSESTIRSQFARAKQKLMQMIKNYCHENTIK